MLRRSSVFAVGLISLAISCSPAPQLTTPTPPRPPADAGAEASSSSTTTTAPPLPLVPYPRLVSRSSPDAFVISATTKIAIDREESRSTAQLLARWLGLPAASIFLSSNQKNERGSIIVLQRTASGDRDPSTAPPADVYDEAYELEVSPDHVLVSAAHSAGIFQGAQTIAHLASSRLVFKNSPSLSGATAKTISIPSILVSDAPRFPFRGMHLDVARHFFSKTVVQRYIDLLAFYRFNVFHWHLTDDQAFRLKLQSHPELAQVGGTDGAYSAEDVKAVIDYARERFITVIPEIEMPGHTRAILAAHPELSCTGQKQEVPKTTWGVFDDVLCIGNEGSFKLVSEVLTEAARMFPSQLFHIGGDEVPTTRYSVCPKCRAAMKASNVNVTALEGVFLKKVTTHLSTLGKRPLVWDEALSSSGAGTLAQNAVVFAWQSADRGKEAATKGYDVVMAPHDQVYFDMRQSIEKSEPGRYGFIPWTKVRSFDPIPDGMDANATKHILGAEAPLWTEFVTTQEQIDSMVVPRMAILAEKLWSPAPATPDKPISPRELPSRINAQTSQLDRSEVRYFIEPPSGLRARKVLMPGDPLSVTIQEPLAGGVFDGSMHYALDDEPLTASSPLVTPGAPIDASKASKISTAVFLKNGRSSLVVTQVIARDTPRPGKPASAFPNGGADLKKGIAYKFVVGRFKKIPASFDPKPNANSSAGGGRITSLDQILHGANIPKEHFALRADGLLKITKAGVYHFVARADDGVRVEIDDQLVLEDDSEHAPRESDGEIALGEGFHTLRISYFQGEEGKELNLKVESAGSGLLPDGKGLTSMDDFVFAPPIR